jgi:hypothetical protein
MKPNSLDQGIMDRLLRMFLGCAALLAAAPAYAQTVQSGERDVEVIGEASVNVTPDFARLTLGVTTAGRDARDALAANAKSVASVIAAIKGEGVAPADVQTSSLSISPNFANPPQNAAPAARPITGYTVTNMVSVTARDPAKVGAIIDKAVESGANAMYGLAYGEDDPSALLDKVRPQAVADARRKAEIYAGAAGAKVGRVLSLTEETRALPRPLATRVFAQNTAAPTPVEPGQDKLTVTIDARFELTD